MAVIIKDLYGNLGNRFENMNTRMNFQSKNALYLVYLVSSCFLCGYFPDPFRFKRQEATRHQVNKVNAVEMRMQPQEGGGGAGGNAIYGPYMNVPPLRVWFSSSLLWNQRVWGLEQGIIFQETDQLVEDFTTLGKPGIATQKYKKEH